MPHPQIRATVADYLAVEGFSLLTATHALVSQAIMAALARQESEGIPERGRNRSPRRMD